jgi:hypothetical protein
MWYLFTVKRKEYMWCHLFLRLVHNSSIHGCKNSLLKKNVMLKHGVLCIYIYIYAKGGIIFWVQKDYIRRQAVGGEVAEVSWV